MSFSDLSREVRNIIYLELLCPPDGVNLQNDWDRRTRNAEEAWYNFDGHSDSHEDDEDLDEGKGKKVNDKGEGLKATDRWGNSDSDASAVTPVPTAIFYVSHQIRQEASEVFYGSNRFTFDTSPRTALNFLECLRPSFGRMIKHIGFTSWATSADDGDCRDGWEPLVGFISRRMSLNSVTVQVPRDNSHGIDKTKEIKQAPNPEWYWWPAPCLVTASVMAGNIKQLRLGYLATLTTLGLEEEVRHKEAGGSRYKDPMDRLESISILRYPQPDEEQEREHLEKKALLSAVEEGRADRFGAWEALLADQETRRQRFNFVVTREDNPIGDVGTVLILTRPTAS